MAVLASAAHCTASAHAPEGSLARPTMLVSFAIECFDCVYVQCAESEEKGSAVEKSSSSNESQQPCAICLTEPRNTALICGHMLCWECAQRVDSCPVCRKFVSHKIRLFQ